jgi:hypothetical protein
MILGIGSQQPILKKTSIFISVWRANTKDSLPADTKDIFYNSGSGATAHCGPNEAWSLIPSTNECQTQCGTVINYSFIDK